MVSIKSFAVHTLLSKAEIVQGLAASMQQSKAK